MSVADDGAGGSDGDSLGCEEGSIIGAFEGKPDGDSLGDPLGFEEGAITGESLGTSEGDALG